MRIRCGTIHIVALAALAVGVAAGWFAAGAWGKCKCENVEVCKYGNMEAANAGRPSAPNGRVVSMKPPKEKAKPRRKTEANVEKQREPEVVKPEEKPAQEGNAAQKKNDNPFPRYLEMFKNDPEALAAEFLKEAEKDREFQAQRRQEAIDKLNLNAEQAAVFEKALDELRDEITYQTEGYVNLIKNGQLNEELASEGRIWESNILVAQEMVAARETAVRQTAEKLYEQLELDGASDDIKQETLFWSAYITSFSYECLEPDLDVYDKVYKNMGVGDGIFSWCRRPHPKEKK